MVGVLHGFTRQDDGRKQLPAVDERGFTQIVAIEIEQIESKEAQCLRLLALECGGTPEAHVVLQKLEGGDTILVKGNDLAIYDRGISLHGFFYGFRRLGELRVHGVAATGNHANFSLLNER